MGWLFVLTFLLSFCSIVYELVLAQSLAAFLQNTVLRYSVTVGLYMFSMGIGSWLVGGRLLRRPLLSLLRLEVILAVCGGFSVVSLFLVEWLAPARWAVSMCGHGWIILIGMATGCELPLLIKCGSESPRFREPRMLAWNYIGALAGTLMFAFVFYRGMGLVATSLLVACGNAVAGLSLWVLRGRLASAERQEFDVLWMVELLAFVVIFFAWLNAGRLNAWLIQRYLA